MTNPSDGRITSLTTFVGPLTGNEWFLIVSPPDPASAINYKCAASSLAQLVTISFNPTTTNFFFAGPTSGLATATPTFRAQVLADLPTGTTGLPIVGNGATTAPSYQLIGLAGGGIGTNSLATGVLLGNVTGAVSVASATTAGYPLVSSSATTQPAFQALNLGSAGVTGVLSVTNGGIGTTALPLDGVVLGNATALTVVPATTGGFPLVSNGSTSAPAFGVLSVVGGGTGTTVLGKGVVLGEGTSQLAVAAATTAGYPLLSNGSASDAVFAALNLGSAGVTGTLAIAHGGTGTTSGAAVHINVQTFTASGTYTASVGLLYAVLEAVGGGGGGGSAQATTGTIFAGGGGGSGAYSRKTASGATIGASQAVTIGTAGGGGASGSNSGTAGGTTSIGALCVALGGLGGNFGSVAQVGLGGAGGGTGTGDVTGAGNPGGSGLYSNTSGVTAGSGNGASSFFGGGALGTSGAAPAAGAAARNYGAGGAGGFANNSTTGAAGGNGSAGFVIITEYLNQ